MNQKYIPFIIGNILLLSSIFVSENNAYTIVTLLFIELFIFTISRGILRYSQAEPGKDPKRLSEKTKAAGETILVAAAIATILLLIKAVNLANNVEYPGVSEIIVQNIWVVAALFLTEAVYLFNTLIRHDKDSMFRYSYYKIFAILGTFYIFGTFLSWTESIWREYYGSMQILAVICIIGKASVDYWAIKKEV